MAAPRFTTSDIERMAARYRAGQTTRDLARIFETDSGTISYRLRRAGVVMRTISQAKRRYSLREDAFTEVADEPTAYWFGFLCADGCNDQRRGSGEVHLVLQKRDIPHLERFADFVGTEKPIRKEARHETYRLSLYSKRMSDDLIRLGCPPRKTWALAFPDVPGPLIAHFVRGYFDGDGSASMSAHFGNPTLAFFGTAAFLSGVQGVLREATHARGMMAHHRSSASSRILCYGGQFQVAAIGDWLYDQATIWLERKRARIASFPRGKRIGYPTARRYVGTAGSVSSETIRKYIEAQKGI